MTRPEEGEHQQNSNKSTNQFKHRMRHRAKLRLGRHKARLGSNVNDAFSFLEDSVLEGCDPIDTLCFSIVSNAEAKGKAAQDFQAAIDCRGEHHASCGRTESPPPRWHIRPQNAPSLDLDQTNHPKVLSGPGVPFAGPPCASSSLSARGVLRVVRTSGGVLNALLSCRPRAT
jgi:hypothetical protein